MKPFISASLLLLSLIFAGSQQALFAQKPTAAVIAGDFADPSIIKVGSQYYSVGTSSEWAPHFPIYTSTDLVNWKQSGYVFEKNPGWTTGSFWAPEYYFMNGLYYIYYTARRKSDNQSFIGVATSRYPDKDFKDHGVLIAFGKEAIDAFIYEDKGQRYISFKAYGLDQRPIELLCYKLSADGLKTEGKPFMLLKDEAKKGMEGQSMLKKGKYYYLFYSGGSCCGINCDYNVQIARSEKFEGPYEYYSGNPVMKTFGNWDCAGHGTFVQKEDGRYYYLFHAYNKQSTVYGGRQGMLAELVWPGENEWPVFKAPEETVAVEKSNLHDAFEEKKQSPLLAMGFQKRNQYNGSGKWKNAALGYHQTWQ